MSTMIYIVLWLGSLDLKAVNSDSCHNFKQECQNLTKEYVMPNRKPSLKQLEYGFYRSNHNLVKHPIYRLYYGIKSRCFNKNQRKWNRYGGRGITMHKEWQNSFLSFYTWAISSGWEKGLQIDRINNDGNYEPSNCRFVTSRINNLNRTLKQKNNKSGYRGVCFNKNRQKWEVHIYIKNKHIYLGTFLSKTDALFKRNEYIIQNKLEKEYPIQEII